MNNKDKYNALVLALAFIDGNAGGYTDQEKAEARKTIQAMLVKLLLNIESIEEQC